MTKEIRASQSLYLLCIRYNQYKLEDSYAKIARMPGIKQVDRTEIWDLFCSIFP